MAFPVAHAACGLTIWLAGVRRQLLPRSSRAVGGIIVVLAVLADLEEALWTLVGWGAPCPRGILHTGAGAVLLAGGAWMLLRKRVGSKAGAALLLFLAATCSHVLLDCVSEGSSGESGVALFWPFSSESCPAPFVLFRELVPAGGGASAALGEWSGRECFWELVLEGLFGALLLLPLAYRRGQGWTARGMLMAAWALALSGVYGLAIEPNWLSVSEVRLAGSRGREKTRVVQLSDLHLRRIGYRERRIKELLTAEVRPDVLLFSGDTFDPFPDHYRTLPLSARLRRLARFVASLPGEKYLVWGEGLSDTRHRLSRVLAASGVNVLEDSTISSRVVEGLAVTGKLPELAEFRLVRREGNTWLTASDSSLNSYLWVEGPQWAELRNYSFTGTFRFRSKTGGIGLLVYCQYGPRTDRFYRVRWSGRRPRPLLFPHGSDSFEGKISSSQLLASDTGYRFRIVASSEESRTIIKARFWPAGAREPPAWDIEAVDGGPGRMSGGGIGVWCNGPSGGFLFDDFEVSALGSANGRGRRVFAEDFEDPGTWSRRWRSERRFRKRIAPRAGEEVNILLAHSPEIIHSYEIAGFDLIVTGDTHGGQVCWPWGTPVYREKNLPADWYSGLHSFHGMDMYVSRGIGTSRVPVRLFCRPEIVVFDFD